MPQTLKDILAVLLALAATGLGVFLMIRGELLTAATDSTDLHSKKLMLDGLMMYFKGIGLAFLVAGATYILVGQEEHLSTTFDSSDKKVLK